MKHDEKHQPPAAKLQSSTKDQAPNLAPGVALGFWRLAFLWCWVLGAGCFSSFAAPVKIELPAETDAFKAAPGAEIANGQCLVCHSVEYVTTQPPLPRAFWAASVKKMREKFGSAIPEEQVEPLLDYLTTHYGMATQNPAPTSGSNAGPARTLISRSEPRGGEAIATKYGCLGCHNVTVKIVGPPYKDIAAKYRHDAAAKPKIVAQIQKGGSGKWGPIIMPPFPQVTDAEVEVLTQWILGQK